MSTPASSPSSSKVPHTVLEDVLALLLGTWVISFGIALMQQAGTLTGGSAGLAFLLHYALGLSFGAAFFVLNLPFYYLAFKRMGRPFVLKTFCAVALVSVFTEVHPHFIQIAHIDPFYAAILGNGVMGLGFIVLFRHKASLGGVNILALYLQERRGWRAGTLQLGLDLAILLASMLLVSLPLLVASIIGAVVMNLIIAMNHRPNRYLA